MTETDGIDAILLVVSQIPSGKVATYGQVAQLAGLPGHARRVGRVLSQLPPHSSIPWHRVINARGYSSLPETGAATRQRQRLESEGVDFTGKRIDLQQHGWRL